MPLLDIETFRREARGGHTPEGALFKLATTEPEVVGGASSRTRRFIFSDSAVDHSNDRINQGGWDLSVFRRNPVALFSHDSLAPPIGKASNVAVVNDRLVGDIEFASASVYPFANTIFELVKGGFIKAVSVGFLPKDWKFTSDKNRPNGIDFIKQILAEISICAVPCNPNALLEARSLGVDTRPLREWAERVLDSGDTVFMPRRDIETIRRQAAEPRGAGVSRLASPSSQSMRQLVDDVGASIAGERQAIRTVQDALASSDDQPLDEVQLKLAVGHFSGAIASKNQALACVRAALALAADNDDNAPPNPPGPIAPDGMEARLRQAARLKAEIAARKAPASPAERLAQVAEMRRVQERMDDARRFLGRP